MGARILIVEDNPAMLELMEYLLTAFGHSVVSAPSGEEGIAIASKDVPDLIVCDVRLPRMSGIDVARVLKQEARLSDVPLVAVTAFAMLGDRDKFLDAGFDGYIAKPIDPEEFVEQIDAFLPQVKRSTAARPTAETGRPLEKPRSNGMTILAVDNVRANLDLASSMLEHAGYTVVTAMSMDEGLRIARRSVPDLILSDVCMPGPGGYELIAEIKKDPHLRAVPFMFLTSTALDPSQQQEGLALGAASYLVRPIEPQQLLTEIDACLKQARQP